jgi:predicted trehalose synthase
MTDAAIERLCERLIAQATASFEANRSFGRKGSQWSLQTEVGHQAAETICALLERVKALEVALTRQCDNMAFALNRVDLRGWTDRFGQELAEDRAAINTGEV